MPLGRTHNTINLAALVPIAWSFSAYGNTESTFIFIGCASYLFATFFMSPDLDLRHSSPSRRWKLLAPFWWPYRLFFRHRGLSHSPLLGSLSRIAYLGVCFVLFFTLFHLTPHLLKGENTFRALASIQHPLHDNLKETWGHLQVHEKSCAAILMGIWLSDFIHIISDRSVSKIKGLFS